MERRGVHPRHDYARLLEMQRYSFTLNFPNRPFHEEWFKGALLSAARRGDTWVYEEQGALVGWLWLDWSELEIAHITHLQVARDHWGCGYGRAILEDAVALARARGRRAVTLNVTKANARAMSLYAHAGFVLAEDHGERQLMRLELQAGA